MNEQSNCVLLSGNEAIARGAYDAGVVVGVGYPGTPSTETLESLSTYDGMYAEWAPNEKVALEVGIGASLGGVRSLVTMKHVGVNVAADPLFTSSYTGVNAGLVILAADDPGIYSSQNEQDSHYYALAAHIPMLDPSNSQESYDFTKQAFDISEEFDIPVFIRSTVRISHTKALVSAGKRVEVPQRPYEKDPSKWVMMPVYAKIRRKDYDRRFEALKIFAESTDLNQIEYRDTDIGVISMGAVYEYVREALPEASTFKIGMSFPLPVDKLKEFARTCKKTYVIEEASAYLSQQIAAAGISYDMTPLPLPKDDEMTPHIIREAFELEVPSFEVFEGALPPRPPSLCPGCPHRLVFNELRRLKAIVTGDIGCYTLGALPPLNAVDSCVDMGASLSMAHGMELAKAHLACNISREDVPRFDLPELAKRPIVGVIGDSTFAHSGITSLLGTVYNGGGGTLCILDNRTTAMTGQQGNPCNGITLQKRSSTELDIVELLEALGVPDIKLVNAQNLKSVRSALSDAIKNEELSVIVFKSPCVLIERTKNPPSVVLDTCQGCGVCVSIGCPALGKDTEGRAVIDDTLCTGCSQCAQNCPFGCIEQITLTTMEDN